MDETRYLENLRVTATAVVLWAVPALYSLFAEGYMIGQGSDGVPLTNVLRIMRLNALGRFILVPFATWLYWHIVLRPVNGPVDRRDFLPVLVGFALALVYGTWYPVNPKP